MRRLVPQISLFAALSLLFAASAAAAPGQVTHVSFHGDTAEAAWFASSPTGTQRTTVLVSRSTEGSRLFLAQYINRLDDGGNFAGGSVAIANLSDGFSFAIDHARLSTGRLDAAGLPVTTCSIGLGGSVFGCASVPVGVHVSWVGVGESDHALRTDNLKIGAFHLISHENSRSREALATGTLAGIPLTAGALAEASLSRDVAGDICLGC